jgi:predicted kinase
MNARTRPALIVIGGPYGSGKTAVATQLSLDLCIPRLDPDVLGRAVKNTESLQASHSDAYRIAYAVLWRLTDEFLRTGVSTIIDANMGWELSWRSIDALKDRNPGLTFLPVVLSCPPETCIERIGRRHLDDPNTYGPPELFENTLAVRTFLDELNRPDVHSIDASLPYDDVYTAVRKYVVANL